MAPPDRPSRTVGHLGSMPANNSLEPNRPVSVGFRREATLGPAAPAHLQPVRRLARNLTFVGGLVTFPKDQAMTSPDSVNVRSSP